MIVEDGPDFLWNPGVKTINKAKTTSSFYVEEVLAAIDDCNGDKAPGPNDFNFNLFKKKWSLLKPDIMEFLHDFHRTSKMPKGINCSYCQKIVL